MIQITLLADGTISLLDRVQQHALRPKPIVQAGTRAVARGIQRHLRQRDKIPNRLGGKRTHFMREAAEQTVVGEVTATFGRVVIGKLGFRQRLEGGTINARPGGLLTIPISPDAHGRTARAKGGGAGTFEKETGLKLFFLKVGGKKKTGFETLVLASARGGGIQVEYLLKKSVIQHEDPTLLPTVAELSEMARVAADQHIDSMIAAKKKAAE